MRSLLTLALAMSGAVAGVTLAGASSVACSPSHTVDAVDSGIDATDAPIAKPEWTPVLEHLDGALLSIWGTSEHDVWTVGGPLGNTGFESLVMRFDGTSWRRSPTGGAETYWWVHGPGPNDVWLVGEKGGVCGTRYAPDGSVRMRCGSHIGLGTMQGDQLARTIEFHKAIGNKFLIVPGGIGGRTTAAEQTGRG
jgi:hypothetical protein